MSNEQRVAPGQRTRHGFGTAGNKGVDCSIITACEECKRKCTIYEKGAISSKGDMDSISVAYQIAYQTNFLSKDLARSVTLLNDIHSRHPPPNLAHPTRVRIRPLLSGSLVFCPL